MGCSILLVRVVLVVVLTLAAHGQKCGVKFGIYEDGSCTTLSTTYAGSFPNPTTLHCGECVDDYMGSGQGAECISCANGVVTLYQYPKGCSDKSDHLEQQAALSACAGSTGYYFKSNCL